MQAFVDRHGLGSMTTVADVDETIWPMYGVRYQPAWVFINQDGETEVFAGELAGPQLENEIEDLLSR